MLVLTRKVDEKIKIGNDITVTVIQVNRGAVKLG
jgi:carbon storage regulator CsrA